LLYQGEETMKRPIFIILSVVAVFVLLGTATMTMFGPRVGNTFSAIGNELPGGYGGGGGAPEYAVPQESYASAPIAANDQVKINMEGMDTANVQTQERMVIQNADLSIVVADPKARMTEIANMANEMGGFVVSSNLYTSYYGPNSIEAPGANIVIRVPSNRLDEALETIKEGVVDVNYENRTGQDVTSIYVDLQSQLSAKQAAEKKLLEFLGDAEDTEGALAVYTQLQIIQSEIEVLKGQIKYYDESVALSAVNVTLVAEETVQPVEIGGWKLQGTANDAVQDLIYFTQGFVQFLIRFVLYTLPALVLMAIPLYLLFLGGRTLFRRFGKSKGTAVEKTEEKK
jgi:flagellar basal body-associated protein FliL